MKTNFFSRITLFILTNLAVVLVLSLVMRLFGLDVAVSRRGINYQALLVSSVVMGFAGSIISLLLSKFMAKWSTGAEVIKQPRSEEQLWLLQTVQRLATQSDIRMPEVAVYDSPEVNAFATGPTRNSALVAVSSGLLHSMTREEVEAVLAHEIAHAANGDMITMSLLQGVLNTFVIFLSRVIGFAVDSFLSGRREGEDRGRGMGYFITTMVLQIVLGMLASIVVSWYSRQREFRADHGAAQLVGPGPMIRALERLRRQEDGPTVLPASMQAFGIRSSGPGFLNLFRSHPPLEARIAALHAFNPGA